jgi:hypothetical protein
MSKMGGMNVETCSQWRDAGAMTLFRRCLLGFNQRSSAATSTALTHHPSHLQTNRHPFARPYNQSPNCGTHISPAPTWTSPTSCTFLRSYSSTKIELYQAAASRLAIGVRMTQLTIRSRMVNFAVAAFIVLGGVAKLFPFNDL